MSAPAVTTPVRRDTNGLVYLNNRYHDPTLGHFISVDPLVGKTGQPYLYANGTPVTLGDPSGLDPGWAHDNDPCNDAGYYNCSKAKVGPNRGRRVLTSFGGRALEEMDRGVGIDGNRWCHLDGSSLNSACGAPELDDEYDDLRTAMAVVDYFADPANAVGAAGDAAVGGARGVAQGVYVLRGRGKNGKFAVMVGEYTADFKFLQGAFPKGAEKVRVGARRLGNAMIVVDVGITGFEEWRATEGHPDHYRVGYTAFETAAKVTGAAVGAAAGGKGGAFVGCAVVPGAGCVVGGAIGAIGGAIFGAWGADQITDWVWEVTPET